MSLRSLIAFASPTPSLGLELTNLCGLYVELAMVICLVIEPTSLSYLACFYTLSCCKFGHSSKCNPHGNSVYDLIRIHGGGGFCRCVQYDSKFHAM